MRARRASPSGAPCRFLIGVVRQSTGMRSEEIQKRLKMSRNEMPRVLQLGLDTKKLKKKGEKRATLYSVA